MVTSSDTTPVYDTILVIDVTPPVIKPNPNIAFLSPAGGEFVVIVLLDVLGEPLPTLLVAVTVNE